MTKQEFNEWVEELKSQGYNEQEIEEIIEDYLNQPENPEWFFIQE